MIDTTAMIPFNVPPVVGNEIKYIKRAIENKKICGDGEFTKKCTFRLEQIFAPSKILLTTSCTSALEMAAFLCNIQKDDEVILPSFTFPSTADAFVRCGAKLVFVDIRPDTMNIDENKIESAITSKTKAIAVVHYAGVACEMDKIMNIAHRYNLKVVEDAAQAIFSTYKGRALGTIGDFGCLSFHETKNLSMGEGGALIINCGIDFYEKAEIIREKGTDRSRFRRGQIDKYTWQDYGSSYLPSDLNAAYLWAQLEKYSTIQSSRIKNFKHYYSKLFSLQQANLIELPIIPKDCVHNAHMFYIKTKNLDERDHLLQFLKEKNILAVFHYIPLHSAPAGKRFGRFNGDDVFTTKESERLVRLPLYYGLTGKEIDYICNQVKKFYSAEK